MKREYGDLQKSLELEKSIKDKYYEMWRKSEGEKAKFNTSRRVLSGAVFSRELTAKPKRELMQIDDNLLEDYRENNELGKGVFGRVQLKRFRGTPVAVKYFHESASVKMVEREAQFLQQCSHLNLPIIFGMNIKVYPYFIVTQAYGNEELLPATLHDVLKGSSAMSIPESKPEVWLHITVQLVEALGYIHERKILHNDIKCDNVLLAEHADLKMPILIDFGKACLISEGRRKVLSDEEQKMYREKHSHIAPEVVHGTQPQSVKSDVYSIGVVFAQLYKTNKIKPVKEIARRCLQDYTQRCNTAELLMMIENFRKL